MSPIFIFITLTLPFAFLSGIYSYSVPSNTYYEDDQKSVKEVKKYILVEEETEDSFEKDTFMECGSIVNVEEEVKYFFQAPHIEHYGPYNLHDYYTSPKQRNPQQEHFHPPNHDFSRNNNYNICKWKFYRDKELDCDLEAHFYYFIKGENRCDRQYMLIRDGIFDWQICGHGGSTPAIYTSRDNLLMLKHLYGNNVDKISSYSGYVICAKKNFHHFPKSFDHFDDDEDEPFIKKKGVKYMEVNEEKSESYKTETTSVSHSPAGHNHPIVPISEEIYEDHGYGKAYGGHNIDVYEEEESKHGGGGGKSHVIEYDEDKYERPNYNKHNSHEGTGTYYEGDRYESHNHHKKHDSHGGGGGTHGEKYPEVYEVEPKYEPKGGSTGSKVDTSDSRKEYKDHKGSPTHAFKFESNDDSVSPKSDKTGGKGNKKGNKYK